jgi:hypothetical protein
MLCRVALVTTDVSEELSASFIRVTRIGELGTVLATLHAAVASYAQHLLACRFLSPWWRRRYVPSKCRFLREPDGVTSQKIALLTEMLFIFHYISTYLRSTGWRSVMMLQIENKFCARKTYNCAFLLFFVGNNSSWSFIQSEGCVGNIVTKYGICRMISNFWNEEWCLLGCYAVWLL